MNIEAVSVRHRTPASIAKELRFEDVRLTYGAVEAVRGITLEVRPGEVMCLLGQSGCGKTSLLRLAAGIEAPQFGRILVDGQEMAGPDIFVPPEQRGIGLVFQDYALFPHLTNLQNVMFGLSGLRRSEAVQEALRALQRVDLESAAQAYPHELSGGQQQRVALARALAPRPGILLLDEPFSGLDRRLRDQVRAETLAVLRDARATCMIVT
ncbi:MAG: iron ABC transporter ATP-binding protein, partial [Azorhizobium sp. 12-66-6]